MGHQYFKTQSCRILVHKYISQTHFSLIFMHQILIILAFITHWGIGKGEKGN